MRKEVSPNSKILRRIVIGIAIYCGAFVLSYLFFTYFSQYFKYNNAMVGTCSSFIAGFAAFLSFKSDEKPALLYNAKAPFAKKPFLILFILFVIVTAYALTIVFNFLFTLIPWEIFGNKNIVQNNDSFYSIPLYMRLIAYVLIGPFAEEMLFRGVIFSRFRKLMPLWAAAVGSSLFFGIYHGNLMQGLYAFIMGSVICVAMDMGGSIFYPLLFHIIANLISNLCYEFDYINNVVYSVPGIAISAAYLVVAIILCYVFKDKLTKKDK